MVPGKRGSGWNLFVRQLVPIVFFVLYICPLACTCTNRSHCIIMGLVVLWWIRKVVVGHSLDSTHLIPKVNVVDVQSRASLSL